MKIESKLNIKYVFLKYAIKYTLFDQSENLYLIIPKTTLKNTIQL